MEKRMLTPKEIAQAVCESGIAKSKLSFAQMLVLGIWGGAFIAFGGFGSIAAAQTLGKIDAGLSKFIFASVFPVGLMLVILCGGELFTGNCLMTLGWLNRQLSWKKVIYNWIFIYSTNFMGAMIFVLALVYSGMVSPDSHIGEMAVKIASAKVDLTFSSAVIRGTLCNIIVTLAVWMAAGAKDVTGKIFACWFTIMLFVVSGYEHCIANMFFIPLGIYMGADITWGQLIFSNLIPVTIGNIIGGAVIVPLFYYIAYLRETNKAAAQKSIT